MTCDRCHQPIRGGYWVVPAPSGSGIVWVCRACCKAPRYPTPHEPTNDETRKLFEQVRMMLNAPSN